MDKQCDPLFCDACNYVSMLELKLIRCHVIRLVLVFKAVSMAPMTSQDCSSASEVTIEELNEHLVNWDQDIHI